MDNFSKTRSETKKENIFISVITKQFLIFFYCFLICLSVFSNLSKCSFVNSSLCFLCQIRASSTSQITYIMKTLPPSLNMFSPNVLNFFSCCIIIPSSSNLRLRNSFDAHTLRFLSRNDQFSFLAHIMVFSAQHLTSFLPVLYLTYVFCLA